MGTKKIIDISQYQTNVDYAKAAQNIDGVIIRIGYRGWGSSGALCKDSKFDTHIKGAVDNKIPYGFYFFSQATSAAEATAEANYAYNLIKNYKPTYPVYIDIEDSGATNNSGRADKNTKATWTEVCLAFCKRIEELGLKGGVYSGEYWLLNKVDTNKLSNYSIWCAKYGTNDGTAHDKPTINTYDGWQFTSNATVPGFSGKIDMSYFYKDFGNTTTKKVETKKEETKSAAAATNSTSKTATVSYKAGNVYTLQSDMKVRTGAGTNYKQKTYAALTADGKKHAYKQIYAVLKKGTKVTLQSVTKKSDTEYWGKIPSGYICLKSGSKIYVK